MLRSTEGFVKLRPKPARPAPPSPSSVFYANRYSQPGEENLSINAALEQSKVRRDCNICDVCMIYLPM